MTPDPVIENWLPVDDAAFNDGVSNFLWIASYLPLIFNMMFLDIST